MAATLRQTISSSPGTTGKDEATACTTASNFAPIGNVEAIDATTVKVTGRAEPELLRLIRHSAGMILQKAQFENCIGAAALTDAACQTANNAPIGTNAWKLKEFKPGDT